MDSEPGELVVRIVGAENVGRSHTIYIVQCSAGVARWEVRKRFSDFVQLHASLKTRQQVSAALPPKRMFGKMTDAVIKMRQEGLEQYLHAVLKDLESEQVRVIYAFLQLPPSLYEGLAPGLGHPQAYGASAGGELSATDAPQQIGEDASFQEVVDNVGDLMIDVFQAPLPLTAADARARGRHYRAMLDRCSFPLEGGEDLTGHFLRIVDAEPLAERPRADAAALLKARAAHLAEHAQHKVCEELDLGPLPLGAQKVVSGSADSLVPHERPGS